MSKSNPNRTDAKITKEDILNAGQYGNLCILIDDLFYQSGIEDWAAARALWHLGFRTHFYWTAAQAIEKLSKACLLSNWENVLAYGHDIVKLCQRVSEISQGIFDLENAVYFSKGVENEKRIEFFHRININGSTSSRYGNATIIGRTHDIFALDEVLFEILRLNCDLSLVDTDGRSNADKLRKNPRLSGPIRINVNQTVYEASAEDFFVNENPFLSGTSQKFVTPKHGGIRVDSAELALVRNASFKGYLVNKYLKQNAKIDFPKVE